MQQKLRASRPGKWIANAAGLPRSTRCSKAPKQAPMSPGVFPDAPKRGEPAPEDCCLSDSVPNLIALRLSERTSAEEGTDRCVNGRSEELLLPKTVEVHRLVRDGGPAVTFLQVALSIVAQLEQEFKAHQDELRYLRDCLNAGRTRTSLPCDLVCREAQRDPLRSSLLCTEYCSDHMRSSERSSSGSEKGPRGTMHALRQTITGHDVVEESPNTKDIQRLGAPWMGPAVPQWPVSDIAAGTAAALEKIFESDFNTWEFDVFKVAKLTNGHPLLFVGWEALCRAGCFVEFPIDPEKACHFFREVEPLYANDESIPYHNNIHAADVTQSVHALLDDFGANMFFDPMDIMGLVVAATIHDMGHDGKNNTFHINTQDNLALRYNDQSVLENFHVAGAFHLIEKRPHTNLFDGLSREQFRVVRGEMINMVLATDMSKHFEKVGDFNNLAAVYGCDADAWREEEKSINVFRMMLLHSADISNPAKSLSVAQQWSKRCMREFFMQGDEEMRLSLPVSPMCDRSSTDVPGSQMGFIDFIVQPTYESLSAALPKIKDVCIKHLVSNRRAWEKRKCAREDEEASQASFYEPSDGRYDRSHMARLEELSCMVGRSLGFDDCDRDDVRVVQEGSGGRELGSGKRPVWLIGCCPLSPGCLPPLRWG